MPPTFASGSQRQAAMHEPHVVGAEIGAWEGLPEIGHERLDVLSRGVERIGGASERVVARAEQRRLAARVRGQHGPRLVVVL